MMSMYVYADCGMAGIGTYPGVLDHYDRVVFADVIMVIQCLSNGVAVGLRRVGCSDRG